MKITIVNCETQEEIQRDMTADELAEYEAAQINRQAEAAKEAEAAAAKASLLEKLGITEEEAKLLLS